MSKHLFFCALFLVIFAACAPPPYPRCEDDSNCQTKGEFCLNQQCSQCRENIHCKADCTACGASGKCEKIPGCCTNNNDCINKMICRDQHCDPHDYPSGGCAKGFVWDSRAGCVPEPTCDDTSRPCPKHMACVQKKCVSPPLCKWSPVYFDFDETVTRKDQNAVIEENARCYVERSETFGVSLNIRLVGHTDETVAKKKAEKIGLQRAENIKKTLIALGLNEAHITTESKGNTEPAVPCGCKEARNHRVETLSR